MSIFEEFIYTREISLSEPVLAVRAVPARRKCTDQEILNRLSYINSEPDKKMLLDNTNKQLRVAASDSFMELHARQAERNFYI
jgi:hypothetical protein